MTEVERLIAERQSVLDDETDPFAVLMISMRFDALIAEAEQREEPAQ